MPSFADLVSRVKQNMYGFSQVQQQWTYLAGDIGSADVSITVNDASQISRGVIEMDGTELMMVKSVNRNTNVVTLDPFARGWAGTTAVAHTGSARIENNPVFPTIRIKETINDVIRSVYPDLFAVSTKKITKISVQYQYAMPNDAEEVLQVKYQIIGPSMQYPYIRHFRFDAQSDTTDFSGGKSIWLGEEVTPGREVYVVYMKEPTELVNDSDDFATVTGLPATSFDAVVYGACMKLSPSLEGPRLLLNTIEASERAAYVQPGSASKVSTYYGQLYQSRLTQEVRKLQDRYPRPINYIS